MKDEQSEGLPTEISRPTPGDTLFQEADDWCYNARLNFSDDPWEFYATGYKKAADVLVDRVFNARHEIDFLVYPIVFLYRHYLELRLKELILAGQDLLNHSPDMQHVHELDVLWASCRKILEEIWPEGSTVELDVVETCIIEFSRKDAQSMGFRYPVTKSGQPTLAGLGRMNIRNLHEVMSRIAAFLDGASMAISAYIDCKQEAEDEAERNAEYGY